MQKITKLAPLQPLTPLDSLIKRHEGFFEKSKLTHINRFGMQSNKNTGYYIYEYNPETGKHEKIWIKD